MSSKYGNLTDPGIRKRALMFRLDATDHQRHLVFNMMKKIGLNSYYCDGTYIFNATNAETRRVGNMVGVLAAAIDNRSWT